MKKGTVWNESELFQDSVTLRHVRRVTMRGLYNTTPTYHTNHGFTSDGEYLVLSTIRNGKSHVLKCEVKTGKLTVLAEFDGIGGRSGIHWGRGGDYPGCGEGVDAVLLCLAPKTKWCVFPVGRRLQAVHLETLEERILIDDVGSAWIMGIPSVSPDESKVVIPLVSAHPEVLQDIPVTKSYFEFSGKEFPLLKILEVAIEGGKARTIYEEQGCFSAHVKYCPGNNNLVLTCRDFPPLLWGGSDGKTSRYWLLDTQTGNIKPLKENYPAPFQVHAAWSFDGERVLYHGPLPKGGYYLGVVTRMGETIKEFILPRAKFYGHVAADPERKAFILDGNVTRDLLVWYFYDLKTPRVEVIARHNTEWGIVPGQFSHPHPLADPTGRWISFNSAHLGRSDVFIVELR